jgi:hypothetical protein
MAALPVIVFVFLPALLVAPFAAWVYLRRARWRRPGRAVGIAYAATVALVIGASAAMSYFYPFGLPGPEERAWRAAALDCARRYAAAQTEEQKNAVDHHRPPAAGDRLLPTCYSLRVAGLTSADRHCGPGSRCARLREALHLPSPSAD